MIIITTTIVTELCHQSYIYKYLNLIALMFFFEFKTKTAHTNFINILYSIKIIYGGRKQLIL